ncbi:MAG: M23 family metallopeptidase, partial [Kangiellaceae bacterium]|nr:M23 family metallopeptidase [Kangiellaceae bacterium]
MSFTILQRSKHGIRSLKVNRIGLIVVVTFAFMLPILTGVGGYQFAKHRGLIADVNQTTVDTWRQELKKQQEELDSAKQYSQKQINALTARVGLLQAHVRRLDAAGSRIADIAGVDSNEFNFGQAPAVGGPETIGLTVDNSSVIDLFSSLEELTAQLHDREQQLTALESLVLDKKIGVERYISGRPIVKGWMSSFYGRRNDPFTGKPAWHAGIDFAGKEGSDIVATAAGVVTYVGKRYGYGLLVEISHG